MWRATIFGDWWLVIYKPRARSPHCICTVGKGETKTSQICFSCSSSSGFLIPTAPLAMRRTVGWATSWWPLPSLLVPGHPQVQDQAVFLALFSQQFIFTSTQIVECKWQEGAESGRLNSNKHCHYSCKIICFQVIGIGNHLAGSQQHMPKSPCLYRTQ